MADDSAPPDVEPADPSETLAALSPADRATWRQTGELPKPATVQAEGAAELDEDDAAPASEATPEPIVPAGGDARAATPPETPSKPIGKRQQQLNDAIRRATAAEIERDEARAALARVGQPQRTEQPAAAKPQPIVDPNDPEPVFEDFLEQPDPYLAHVRATAAWDRRQYDREQGQLQAHQRAEQAARDQYQAYVTREQAIRATRPDFDAITAPVRQAIDLRYPLGQALIASPVAPSLILHFAEHPDDFQRIGALGTTNLPAALRELGKLEARYDTASPASAQLAIPPKTVSSAPTPPTTLGTRPADPADAEAGAIARGDFRAFRDAANARDAARVRTR